MQERTLIKPLSGTEIKQAILAKIEAAMDRDCTLTKINAYPSFAFTCDLKITFQTLGSTKGTQVVSAGTGGEVVADLPEEMETVAVSNVEKPPNQVRQEAGLGIPTAVKGADGKVREERPKYADPQFMEQARKKGK
jgi:hypothetical protein